MMRRSFDLFHSEIPISLKHCFSVSALVCGSDNYLGEGTPEVLSLEDVSN